MNDDGAGAVNPHSHPAKVNETETPASVGRVPLDPGRSRSRASGSIAPYSGSIAVGSAFTAMDTVLMTAVLGATASQSNVVRTVPSTPEGRSSSSDPPDAVTGRTNCV